MRHPLNGVKNMAKRAKRAALTSEEVRRLMRYDPETGEFAALVARGSLRVGDSLGGFDDEGRRIITIDNVRYGAHRLAWLYMTGAWPSGEIDHRDTNPSNNVWSNLRDVTPVVNKQNKRRAQSGKLYSPLLGAQWCKQARKWKSSIRVAGRTRHLGFFASDQEAAAAYVLAKRQLHEGCTL